jgi:carboxyl-terminal processing protease
MITVVLRLTSCVSRFGIFCFVLAFAPGSAVASEQQTLPWEEARRFVEAMEKIRAVYVEPVDDATLFTNAIRGMAAGLDPYSTYLDPAEHEQVRIDATGRYEGIGLELSLIDGGYVVIAPLHGGPAQRAGLLPGDRLLQADGVPLESADPLTLDRLLHGPAGSELTLTVQRGDEPFFDVVLKREMIAIPSVTGEQLEDGSIYLRLTRLSDGTARDLVRLLRRLGINDSTGLIIDLRNNAGGVVDGAVAIADEFLDRGVIVSTRGRLPEMNHVYEAQAGALAATLPIIVLVNQGTASAAEILAAALQENGRAEVLGTRTFGKGAVQTLVPLEDGGALKLTTAYYRTPAGQVIHDAGILPDHDMPEADTEPLGAPAQDKIVQRARDILGTRKASR